MPVTYGQGYWENLPKQEGLVNDFENLFTDEQEHYLETLLIGIESHSDAQIVIITLPQDSTSKEQFDALTLHIANSWGVGEAGKDNGILIAVS